MAWIVRRDGAPQETLLTDEEAVAWGHQLQGGGWPPIRGLVVHFESICRTWRWGGRVDPPRLTRRATTLRVKRRGVREVP